MAKFKGKSLSLLIDSVEVNLEATSIVLQNEEADEDAITFAELANGSAVTWFFQITATSDYGAGSFWDTCWQNAGKEVPYTFKPYGNEVASATQPHFTGNCTVAAKPPVGGDAGSVFTFEVRMDCSEEPALVSV